jgi:hypothetical protein
MNNQPTLTESMSLLQSRLRNIESKEVLNEVGAGTLRTAGRKIKSLFSRGPLPPPVVGEIRRGTDSIDYKWNGNHWIDTQNNRIAGTDPAALRGVTRAQLPPAPTPPPRPPVPPVPPISRLSLLRTLIQDSSWKKALIGAGIITAAVKYKDTVTSKLGTGTQSATSTSPQQGGSGAPTAPVTGTSPQPASSATQPVSKQTVSPEIQKLVNDARIAIDQAAASSAGKTAQVRNAMEKLDMFVNDIPAVEWTPAAWLN